VDYGEEAPVRTGWRRKSLRQNQQSGVECVGFAVGCFVVPDQIGIG
jgi:hypothetical protein